MASSHYPYRHNEHLHARRSPHTGLPVPVIPDLRFEQSYLRSIRPYVHITGESQHESPVDEKERGVVDKPGSREVSVQIDWRKVVWVTIRDQLISPLLQGTVWGVVGYFLRPSLYYARQWWITHNPFMKLRPGQEGRGVSMLRDWARTSTGGVGGKLHAAS